MAKITTYPNDTNITGGDKLIGTDINNSDATKNFTVSDLLAYMSANITNFVPYTGATGNVDLGANNLTVGGGLGVGGGLFVSGAVLFSGSSVFDDTNITGLFQISGSSGASGQVLTSAGLGNPPVWSNPLTAYVPYTGATGNVDLGANSLEATGVDVKTGPLLANGAAGTSGDYLTSGGAGTNPTWTASPFGKNYGSFYSSLDQTCVSGGLEAMIYENTDLGDGNINIGLNGSGDATRITFAKGGVYNIQFSAQIQKTGGSEDKLSIWLRKNGVDVPSTNTHVTLKANQNYAVAAWNFFVSVSSLQYVEIMWSQNGSVSIVHEPPDVVIPHPATPSVILTVNQIS